MGRLNDEWYVESVAFFKRRAESQWRRSEKLCRIHGVGLGVWIDTAQYWCPLGSSATLGTNCGSWWGDFEINEEPDLFLDLDKAQIALAPLPE